MPCNGICQKFTRVGRVTTRYGQGRYDQGQRRCTTCEIFISAVVGIANLCPCCRSKLRSRPRRMMFKNKFRDRISYANRALAKPEMVTERPEYIITANIDDRL